MNRYKVYQVDILDYGDGHVDKNKTLLGVTVAPSPAKAVNNVKFRLGIKPSDLSCYYSGDGGRRSHLEAELTV